MRYNMGYPHNKQTLCNANMHNMVNFMCCLGEVYGHVKFSVDNELDIHEDVLANLIHSILLVHRDLSVTIQTAIGSRNPDTKHQTAMSLSMQKIDELQRWIDRYSLSWADGTKNKAEHANNIKLAFYNNPVSGDYYITKLANLAIKYQPNYHDTAKQSDNFTVQEMLDDSNLCEDMVDDFLKKTGLITSLQKYKLNISINGVILTINKQ